jgi:hypothetical protein
MENRISELTDKIEIKEKSNNSRAVKGICKNTTPSKVQT